MIELMETVIAQMNRQRQQSCSHWRRDTETAQMISLMERKLTKRERLMKRETEEIDAPI